MPESLKVTDSNGQSRNIKMVTYNGAQRSGPAHLLYMGGLMADSLRMSEGSKTASLREWTAAIGIPFTTFNFHAHGNDDAKSDGEFKDTTLTRMLTDLHTVVNHISKDGRPVILAACSTSNSFAYHAIRMLNSKEPLVPDIISIAPVWADALTGVVSQQYTKGSLLEAFNQFGFARIKSPTLEQGEMCLGEKAYHDLAGYTFANRNDRIPLNANVTMVYGSEDRVSRPFVDMVAEKLDAPIRHEMLINTGHAITGEQTLRTIQKVMETRGYRR